MTFDRLQVVFKVVERCNINCDYCYYFNMGDHSAMSRPPVVSVDTAREMAKWLAEGCADLGIKQLSISFHGGEPMMLKARNFDAICAAFSDQLADALDLSFNMQTNGTIFSDAWMDVLKRHRVHLGFSIDGGREAHDRHRLDHKERSTFDVTVKNLEMVRDAAVGDDAYLGPATIAVMDSANDYGDVFSFLDGLDVKRMSFLLPDRSHDLPFMGGKDTALAYGQALFEVFQAWFEKDDSNIYIRNISDFLSHFQLSPADQDPDFPEFAKDSGRPPRVTQVIIMHSDGKVGVNDSYIPALSWFERAPEYSISNSTLREFLADPIFEEIEGAISDLPAKCRGCKWKDICKGGDLENRFSKSNGFDNPSVYCEGLQYFYEMTSRMLVENGYPANYVELAIAS